MGQKHNRKRIRHRPVRRQRLGLDLEPSGVQPGTLPITQNTTGACKAKPYCWQAGQITNGSGMQWHFVDTLGMSPNLESDAQVMQRMFGGSELDEASIELCLPMVNVMFGLFGALDYQDDSM